MNEHSFIQVELLSDTAFSRGEGTAGRVDMEVEHDCLGLPFLAGKTLRGLLRDSWLSMKDCFPEFWAAAMRLFGSEADLQERSILRIGDAVVDGEARKWIEAAEMREQHSLPANWVLEALTDIRRQTAENRSSGAPAKPTLRSVRVVIRGLKLCAPLLWTDPPDDKDIRCLALCLLATRHAGLARNRGRGHVIMSLDGDIERTRRLAKGESA